MPGISANASSKAPFAKRGLVRLTDFRKGLNNRVSPLLIDNDEVADIQNYTYEEAGALKKRPGYVRRFAAAFGTGPVRGLTNYRKEDGRSLLVFACDGKLFYDQPNFSQLYDLEAEWETSGVMRDGITTTEVVGDIKPVPGTLSALGNISLGGRGGSLGGSRVHRQKIWQSNTLDISGVTDKTTGRIVKSVTLPTGTTSTIETRYGTDGVTFGAWTALGGGDTITGVGANTKMQVRDRFNSTAGLRASAQSFTVLFDQTSSATVITTGLSTSARLSFATMNDTLWIVNGEDADRKWDATTFAAMGGTPPTGKYVISHKQRLFIANASGARSRIYYSDVGTPETWNALSFIDVGKGDGDTITGLGILLDTLIITKENSVWALSGDSSSNFVLRRVTDEGGSSAMAGFALLRDTLAWMGKDGVRFFDGVRSALASQNIPTTLDGLNKRQLAMSAGILWDFSYFLAAPEGASLTNSVVLVYDTNRSAWTVFRGIPAGEFCIFKQFNQDSLIIGDSNQGQLYNWDSGMTDDGAAIDAYVITKALAPAGGIEAPSFVPDVFVACREPSSLATTAYVSFYKDLGAETSALTLSMAATPLNVLRAIPSTVGVTLPRSLAVKVRHNDSGKGLIILAIDLRYSPRTIRAT